MNEIKSLDRRSYLTLAAATTGVTAVNGCLTGISSEGSQSDAMTQDTYLPRADSQADSQVDPTDLPYPGYGQKLPDVTIPAPLHDQDVSVKQFETDVFMTFFYSTCKTVCPLLIYALRNIQTQAEQDGYSDEVTFLAITFDPQRDTEERLQEYAERMDVDRDLGNWYFLRPESVERAKTIVYEKFGVGFKRTTPENMDQYMFNHLGLVLLANEQDYVERAWMTKGPAWQELYDSFTTLREREG